MVKHDSKLSSSAIGFLAILVFGAVSPVGSSALAQAMPGTIYGNQLSSQMMANPYNAPMQMIAPSTNYPTMVPVAEPSASNNHAPVQMVVANTSTGDQPEVTVSGVATTNLDADRVILWFGVDVQNKTASGALDKNDQITQNVINALEAAGVKPTEMQTAYFSINPIYQSAPNTYGPGNLTGYSVSNTIQVTSSNLQNISSWIDAAVKAGADRVNNVYFTISSDKMKSSLSTLTSQAIADARSKADQVASDVGLKVVGIKSMYTWNYGGGLFYGALAPSAGPTGSVPIISGQQQVSVSVSIVYILG